MTHFFHSQSLEKNYPLPSVSQSKPCTSPEIAKDDKEVMLDIRSLREKSKNLDLPLISALCNDRYLLKQTKAFVMPKHPTDDANASGSGLAKSTRSASNSCTSSKNKYPVSGLSSTQITKPLKKALTSAHRHPSEIVKGTYQVNSTTRLSIKKDPSRLSHS